MIIYEVCRRLTVYINEIFNYISNYRMKRKLSRKQNVRRRRTYRLRKTSNRNINFLKSGGGDPPIKVLLTDVMFPNKYAKWRLVEIKSFINHYKCDILIINRISSVNGIPLDFDYDTLKNDFSLENYNILIFNPSYNYINKYNDSFDGTTYNNLYKADYMLRHKNNKDNDFFYNIVYHIFLINYVDFNNKFSFPQDNQYIHLYPGGGYMNKTSLDTIKKGVKIVGSQEFISKYINKNEILNVYGGPFFYMNEQLRIKEFKNTNITVCFTSLGNPIEKGADVYIKIAGLYKYKHPATNVKFISIGVCPKSEFVEHLEAMEQNTLSNYYYNNVDILISLDTGIMPNGFPLGIEAASEGCILLTTDIHNQNKLNNFNFNPFYIIDKANIEDIIERIYKVSSDMNFRKEMSMILQKNIYNLFSYNNTMVKIFNFIKGNMNPIKLTSI